MREVKIKLFIIFFLMIIIWFLQSRGWFAIISEMVSHIVKMKHHNQIDKSMFYFKRRSGHVFFRSFSSLNDEKKGAGITIRKSQLVTMVMFNIMTILVYSGLCNDAYDGEYVGHVHIKIGKGSGISPLTKWKVKQA